MALRSTLTSALPYSVDHLSNDREYQPSEKPRQYDEEYKEEEEETRTTWGRRRIHRQRPNEGDDPERGTRDQTDEAKSCLS